MFALKIILIFFATFSHSLQVVYTQNVKQNILIFLGGGTYSHKLSVWPLANALADKGYNVTVVSGFKKQPFNNPMVRDLFSVAINNVAGRIYKVDRFRDRLESNYTSIFDNYNKDTIEICETIMYTEGDPVLDYVIEEGRFDLVINNAIYGDCGLVIAHQKGAKTILHCASPFIPWYHDEFGFPDETATIPNMSRKFSYPMHFWDRFVNYFSTLSWFISRHLFVYPKLEAIMKKKYGLENVPAYEDVYRKTDLVLLGSHHSIDFTRSLPPFVVNVGGMHCFVPTEPLNEDYKNMLDKATDGAVLMAFGSTINLATLPPDTESSFFAMVRRFSSLLFIWRWDGSIPESKPANLILSKWLPQIQILAHPNLKAFISHGGLNSLMEATYHGIPVILIPLFADQDYIGYSIEAKEVGIRLEMREINAEILIQSLDQILTNSKYLNNMKSASAMFKDRPMNPIDTAVYWTEFVLRHNTTKSLKPLQNITASRKRFRDIALILLLLTTFILSIFFHLILKMFQKCGEVIQDNIIVANEGSGRGINKRCVETNKNK